MISKLLVGKNIYFKSKIKYLGALHGESDALFGFYRYQECFNTFSTLIFIFINFGAERKLVIFYYLISAGTH